MNKKEFVRLFAKSFGITQAKARAGMDEMFRRFVDELFEVGELGIPEFGKFKLKVEENKPCMNPRTKEKIIKPLSIVVFFTPRKLFTHKLHKLGARTRKW